MVRMSHLSVEKEYIYYIYVMMKLLKNRNPN